SVGVWFVATLKGQREAAAAAARADAAEAARVEAEKLTKEANEARAQVEVTLARSLLRPLGHYEWGPNDIELEALWELAESPSDRVRLLFIENALQQPGTARQLRNRRELAVHAAVGLDPGQRHR